MGVIDFVRSRIPHELAVGAPCPAIENPYYALRDHPDAVVSSLYNCNDYHLVVGRGVDYDICGPVICINVMIIGSL